MSSVYCVSSGLSPKMLLVDIWFSSPLSLPLLQAQLIHDRNTASHAAINDKAESGPEQVHMTWTKDKLFTERNRNRECNANVAVRDLFNMKP